jgi:hypothetical protein
VRSAVKNKKIKTKKKNQLNSSPLAWLCHNPCFACDYAKNTVKNNLKIIKFDETNQRKFAKNLIATQPHQGGGYSIKFSSSLSPCGRGLAP